MHALSGLSFACLILSSGAALAGQASDFGISIDQPMWDKWGFEYPVTYVFRVSDVSPQTTVLRRDSDSKPWKPLERKMGDDILQNLHGIPYPAFPK